MVGNGTHQQAPLVERSRRVLSTGSGGGGWASLFASLQDIPTRSESYGVYQNVRYPRRIIPLSSEPKPKTSVVPHLPNHRSLLSESVFSVAY
jgi:hypothetical protein